MMLNVFVAFHERGIVLFALLQLTEERTVWNTSLAASQLKNFGSFLSFSSFPSLWSFPFLQSFLLSFPLLSFVHFFWFFPGPFFGSFLSFFPLFFVFLPFFSGLFVSLGLENNPKWRSKKRAFLWDFTKALGLTQRVTCIFPLWRRCFPFFTRALFLFTCA